MTAEKILAKYAELLRNAMAISLGLNHAFDETSEHYSLIISGNVAHVLEPFIEDPEFPTITRRVRQSFPALLLNEPLPVALAWAARERERRINEDAARREAQRLAATDRSEAADRELYQQLKARFEKDGKPPAKKRKRK